MFSSRSPRIDIFFPVEARGPAIEDDLAVVAFDREEGVGRMGIRDPVYDGGCVRTVELEAVA